MLIMIQEKSSSSETCGICGEDIKREVEYCEECGIPLCEDCLIDFSGLHCPNCAPNEYFQ